MSNNPVKKLRVGIIGMGHWGPHLIRNFYDHAETQVIAIADHAPARLALARESYPGVRVTSEWRDLVSAVDIDAIIIATPTNTHFEISLAALNAGKHLFVEKPLATRSVQARELITLARSRNLKLFVGHIFLFNPAIQSIRKMLEAKALGKLFYFYFRRTNLGPVRVDVNALWDLAPHDIAILYYLLQESPEEISASGSSFINPPVQDVVFAHLKYRAGLTAHLHVSWIDPRKVRELVIVGSEKMLVFEDTDIHHPVRIYHKGIGEMLTESKVSDTLQLFRKSIFQGEMETPVIPVSQPLSAECQSFIDWVLRDVPHDNTEALTLSVVRTLEVAQTSLENVGQPLTFSGSLAAAKINSKEFSDSGLWQALQKSEESNRLPQ